MPWLVFAFTMGHLTINHVYRTIYEISPDVIEITGTQMVLVMKLSSFAWNVYDGRRDINVRSLAALSHPVRRGRQVLTLSSDVVPANLHVGTSHRTSTRASAQAASPSCQVCTRSSATPSSSPPSSSDPRSTSSSTTRSSTASSSSTPRLLRLLPTPLLSPPRPERPRHSKLPQPERR